MVATLAITALYFLILLWLAWQYLRHRDPLLPAVMSVIAAVAMLFVLTVVQLLVGSPPRPFTVLFSLLLLGQPFFVVRMISRVRPVPTWGLVAALAAWVATAVPVTVLPQPMPHAAALVVVGTFFAVEVAAAGLLAAEARRRGGAARQRLGYAAAGTASFGVALLLAGSEMAGSVVTLVSRAVALLSAVMYLLAFAPPRWLRQHWSTVAAYAVMRQLLDAPVDEPPERTWQRYCEGARTVLGPDEVAVVSPTAEGGVCPMAGTRLPSTPGTYPAEDLDRLLDHPPNTVDALAGWTHPPRLAADLARASGTRFVTAAPMTLGGRVGALLMLNRYRVLFAEDDVALVAGLAAQAAAVAGRATVLAAQQRLAVIVESSHDAIVSRDLDGIVTSWNSAAEQLYGYTAAEMVGRPGTAIVPPENREAEAAMLTRAMRGERVERQNLTRRRKDGTDITVALTVSPITLPDGTVVGVASISRDVSERQRAAAMFRGLLEAAPDAMLGITRDGTITLLNAQAAGMFGYRREELLGQCVDRLLPPDTREASARQRVDYFADPVPQRMGAGIPLTAVRKDGTEFPAEISLSALETDEGTIVSIAVRDLTERLQAQAERDRLAAAAEHAAVERRLQHTRRLESLGQLAGGVAHDFNNLLGVISSYTELLLDTVDDPAARADLGRIAHAAERAAGLTKQLLVFGRRDITQAQVLNLNHVVGDVEEMLRRTLGEHIHLITDLDRRAAPVNADPSQLEQILLNLAVNARDAMPTGGTLSIDTTNVDLTTGDDVPGTLPPGRYVRLRVSDTGTGMAPEVLERAFEPFYTTKPPGAGSGLGLATVYGLATAAGGDVRLQSEPGIGTTVTVLLPATSASPAAPGAAGGPSAAAPATQQTILLVEDEDALREVTARILTRAGYHVLTAADGTAAVHTAATHPAPIHLLLSDVIMPGMTGNQVAAHIRAIHPETPVLYMSGYAQPFLAENGTLPPDVTIVEKPFTSQQLLTHIRRILEPRQATHADPAAPRGSQR